MTILSIIGWVATLAVAFVLGKGGIDKIRGTQEMVGNFAYLKLERYRVVVGVAEILAVILLLSPATSLYGAVIVISLMSGAAALHMSAMGGAKTWFPIVVGVLSVLAHYLR